MYTSSIMSKDVEDFKYNYTPEHISYFCLGVDVYSLDDEDHVILEACPSLERVAMHVSFDPLPLYFYF